MSGFSGSKARHFQVKAYVNAYANAFVRQVFDTGLPGLEFSQAIWNLPCH